MYSDLSLPAYQFYMGGPMELSQAQECEYFKGFKFFLSLWPLQSIKLGHESVQNVDQEQ